MRILMTGATGLVGSALRLKLVARGHTLVCHTRKPRPQMAQVTWLLGAATDPQTFAATMGQVDAVIHLAGAPIAQRWTRARRQEIMDSRVLTTRALVQACKDRARPVAANTKPLRWLNASAVGFYGAHATQQCDETSGRGTGFLADVCAAWEAELLPLAQVDVQAHAMRLGVVLAREGGLLPTLRRATQSYVGGPLGDGSQYLSWIHLEDVIQLFVWALAGPTSAGPINTCAPNPSHQAEVMQRLGQLLKKPVWLRAPAAPLRWMMGQMADELLLGGQNVVPKAALSGGFRYAFPVLEGALRQLLLAAG